MTARQPSVPNLMLAILKKSRSELREVLRDGDCGGRRSDACVRCGHDLAHLLHGGFEVALAEKRCAADENISTGTSTFGGGLKIDAAIHADLIRQTSLTP